MEAEGSRDTEGINKLNPRINWGLCLILRRNLLRSEGERRLRSGEITECTKLSNTIFRLFFKKKLFLFFLFFLLSGVGMGKRCCDFIGLCYCVSEDNQLSCGGSAT